MKPEDLFDAIGSVDDKLLLSCDRIPSRTGTVPLLTTAACFVLLCTGLFAAQHFSVLSPAHTETCLTDTGTSTGETEAPPEITQSVMEEVQLRMENTYHNHLREADYVVEATVTDMGEPYLWNDEYDPWAIRTPVNLQINRVFADKTSTLGDTLTLTEYYGIVGSMERRPTFFTLEEGKTYLLYIATAPDGVTLINKVQGTLEIHNDSSFTPLLNARMYAGYDSVSALYPALEADLALPAVTLQQPETDGMGFESYTVPAVPHLTENALYTDWQPTDRLPVYANTGRNDFALAYGLGEAALLENLQTAMDLAEALDKVSYDWTITTSTVAENVGLPPDAAVDTGSLYLALAEADEIRITVQADGTVNIHWDSGSRTTLFSNPADGKICGVWGHAALGYAEPAVVTEQNWRSDGTVQAFSRVYDSDGSPTEALASRYLDNTTLSFDAAGRLTRMHITRRSAIARCIGEYPILSPEAAMEQLLRVNGCLYIK